MAGVSLAIGRLSAMIGASSAAGGAALSGIGFAALAAGFAAGAFASAILTDFPALFIERVPCCRPGSKITMFSRPAIRPERAAFIFYVRTLSGHCRVSLQGVLRARH